MNHGDDLYTPSFEKLLLGVYRHDGTFKIYPRPGFKWSVVFQHEYTHQVLAVSTTAGFLHQILVYMSAEGRADTKKKWRCITNEALQRCIKTHEAAATYCGLQSDIETTVTEELFLKHEVPDEYQEFYLYIDQLIPGGLFSSQQKVMFAQAIATYAMDLPITAWAACSFEEVFDSAPNGLFPPNIDKRFLELIGKLSSQPDVVDVMMKTLKNNAVAPRQKEESAVDYYAKRRKSSYKISCLLRATMIEAFSHEIPAVNIFPTELYKLQVNPVLDHWKNLLRQNGDNVLDGFSRMDDTNDLPDPLLSSGQVVMPNFEVSGLVRLPVPEDVPGIPSIMVSTRAAVDCELSPGLIMRKGQWYSRYYYLTERGELRPRIFYTIGDTRPVFMRDGAIQVFPGKSGDLFQLDEGTKQMPLVRTCGSLDHNFLEVIARSKEKWETMWTPWKNMEDIVLLSAYCAKKNLLVLFVAMSAGANVEIADEILHVSHKPEISEDHVQLLKRVLTIAPLLFPSEGVILSQ